MTTTWSLPAENRRVTLRTYQGPPENSCRPAVDVLFRSVADIYKPHALAVEMTGMGQDGLRGCELIREFGGQILAQDQASSVVWGMPGFVANAGLADKVLPLDQLGMEIIRRVRNGREAIREFKSAPRTVESSNPKMTLSQPEFNYVRRLVLDQSAIVLEEDKGYLVESRLLPLARREGFASHQPPRAEDASRAASGLASPGRGGHDHQ